MKRLIMLSLALFAFSSYAAPKKEASAAELKKRLNQDIETVGNYCMDPVNNDTKELSPRSLRGQALTDYKRHLPDAEHDGDGRTIGIYSFKAGKDTVILLTNIDSDGAGYCDFYTSLKGKRIGTMSGTESEGWDEIN